MCAKGLAALFCTSSKKQSLLQTLQFANLDGLAKSNVFPHVASNGAVQWLQNMLCSMHPRSLHANPAYKHMSNPPTIFA